MSNVVALPSSHPPAHAVLSASSSERWMNCPGSIKLSAGLPDIESIYAKEGTAAHQLGYECLKNNQDAAEYIDRFFNGVEVTDEMADAVQVHLDLVRKLYEPDKGDILWLEQRFNLEPLKPPIPMYGTADVVIYKPYLKLLIVIDYKHGAGIKVEIAANSQVRYYAVGAALKLPSKFPVAKVRTIITQPRAPHKDGPIREEEVPADQLIEWVAHLMERAHATQEPGAPLQAGDWCTFCPAAPTCPELRKQAAAVAKIIFSDDMSYTPPPVDPTSLTIDQVARVLDAADLVATWVRAVRAYAVELLQRGEDIPRRKLVPKRALRHWLTEDITLLTAGLIGVFGMNEDALYKDPKIKSPAQVEKLIPRPLRKRLAEFAEPRSSGFTLAPLDDPRSAVAPQQITAHDVFGDPDE